MSSKNEFDVVVVGGGPIGWATAYEVAKAGSSVIVLEQNTFFNQAGSSNDMARMFRTMYTENYMADLAKKSMDDWDNLERDAGVSLRLMTGLLNFGDPDFGEETPEGTLLGPIENLKRLDMDYKEFTAAQIEKRYPFKNLPEGWKGLYAPDNGVINVPLLLRTVSRLARDYGATGQQHVCVKKLEPLNNHPCNWKAVCVKESTDGEQPVEFFGKKIVLTPGAYVNHVLRPSFGFEIDLDIWEMTATYFSVNPGPNGTVFPSMWFQFSPDKNDRSQLFYGFPVLPWGPPNVSRIAVDAATHRISDPLERRPNIINPEDIEDVRQFVKDSVVGVDWQVPFYSSNCLQTNVFDNMFVMDFIPEKYLNGGAPKSVAVFTAGWAMKFVPLLGRALKEMILSGDSNDALPQFSIERYDPETGKSVIKDPKQKSSFAAFSSLVGTQAPVQAKGSSRRSAVAKA